MKEEALSVKSQIVSMSEVQRYWFRISVLRQQMMNVIVETITNLVYLDILNVEW